MLGAIRKVLFWTYERGSWQYDVLCGVILCFIFLTPATVFDGSAFRSDAESARPEKPAQAVRPSVPATAAAPESDAASKQGGRP